VGQHSGPYRSTDPNKPDEVMDAEAALAYGYLIKHETPEYICDKLGISRATFYRRIQKLMLRLDRPTRTFMRQLEADRLEEYAAHLVKLRNLEISARDHISLIAELRQLSAQRLRLLEDDADSGLDDHDDAEEWIDDEQELTG
jgi:hypothetical protein